jgi:hypothetical protein
MTKAQAMKRLAEARQKVINVCNAGHLSLMDGAKAEKLLSDLRRKVKRS